MRYCVLFPETENVHLIKDVGMIAYKLNKLFGYDAFIASYENGEYPYLKEEVKGLKMDIIEKKHKHFINIFRYLKRNAKSIDVLQIFHMTLKSVIYAFLYKFFNSEGKIFLKLDCTERLLSRIQDSNFIVRRCIGAYLNKVDIIGVEQKGILEQLKVIIPAHSSKLQHIPNGVDFDTDALRNCYSYEDKENIILSVGRIGSSEKGHEVLLEAFNLLGEEGRGNWKLVFVGPVEESFKAYTDKFFEKAPDLKHRVIFTGPVYDREALYEYYKKAKVFCMTSKYESFGIVLIEAAACGDAIISTKVGIADELIGDKEFIVPESEPKLFASALNSLLHSEKLQEISRDNYVKCKEAFDWDKIVTDVKAAIESL